MRAVPSSCLRGRPILLGGSIIQRGHSWLTRGGFGAGSAVLARGARVAAGAAGARGARGAEQPSSKAWSRQGQVVSRSERHDMPKGRRRPEGIAPKTAHIAAPGRA
jgi:hypothetical protein